MHGFGCGVALHRHFCVLHTCRGAEALVQGTCVQCEALALRNQCNRLMCFGSYLAKPYFSLCNSVCGIAGPIDVFSVCRARSPGQVSILTGMSLRAPHSMHCRYGICFLMHRRCEYRVCFCLVIWLHWTAVVAAMQGRYIQLPCAPTQLHHALHHRCRAPRTMKEAKTPLLVPLIKQWRAQRAWLIWAGRSN